MALDPVQRLIEELNEMKSRIKALETRPLLENSSVTDGRLRFIGGLLLIDSGGRLEVVGELDGEGNFEWSGPWKFDSGDGEIGGNVRLTGDVDLTGDLDVAAGRRIRVGP